MKVELKPDDTVLDLPFITKNSAGKIEAAFATEHHAKAWCLQRDRAIKKYGNKNG